MATTQQETPVRQLHAVPKPVGGKPQPAPTTAQGRSNRPKATASRSELCERTIGGCRRCGEYPDRPCPACTQRRRRATQLLEDGCSVWDIANKMRLTVPRTERYIEEEELARDLLGHRCDHVPVALVRALFEQRCEEDPSLNQSRLARDAKLDRSDLLRALGLAKCAPTVRNGRREPGEIQTEVGVETAAKIVRALGFDLHQVPGL